MAWSITNKRTKRALNTFEKGIFASVLGVVFLLAPSFSGSSPVLETVAAGLQVPGWLALGIGLALMAVHFAFKSKTEEIPDVPVVFPNRRAHASARDAFETTQPPAPSRVNVDSRREPANKPQAQLQRASDWTPDVFSAIEWRRFGAVCEALFAQAGFETRSQAQGSNGGVDIWLHSANAPEPFTLVRCKHWQAKPVDIHEVHEFFDLLAAHQLRRGTHATTSGYTAEARQFAHDKGIATLDGGALLDLIATRTPEQQQALLAIAFEGEYWRPTCASCGIKLVEYSPTQGGAAFWACSNYRSCNTFLPKAQLPSG